MVSASLAGVLVSKLARNARAVGSIPHFRCNISNFHQPYDPGFHDQDPVQTTHCMVVEPSHVYIQIHSLYVIVSIKWPFRKLTIPAAECSSLH